MGDGLDNVAYRVGFEDACDSIAALLEGRKDVNKAILKAVDSFAQGMRRAKGKNILADIEMYRDAVRKFVG